MFLILNNAAQGILSSFFFKYADTILKKYSSTVATIFTGIASAALFGHVITMNFLLGISIVFISMPLLYVSTFVQAARNNVLLAVPALLYAINNYLKFTMQLYINPANVKMLSNLKVSGHCCSIKDDNAAMVFHHTVGGTCSFADTD